MGKSTRFAIERNQTLPHRGTISDQQSKSLCEPTLTKPKPPGKLDAEARMPETQGAQSMVAEAQSVVASAKRAAHKALACADKAAEDVKTSEAKLAKAVGKLGAEKLTPEEQRRRFIEAAREAGASEDEADLDAALKQIAKPSKPDAV